MTPVFPCFYLRDTFGDQIDLLPWLVCCQEKTLPSKPRSEARAAVWDDCREIWGVVVCKICAWFARFIKKCINKFRNFTNKMELDGISCSLLGAWESTLTTRRMPTPVECPLQLFSCSSCFFFMSAACPWHYSTWSETTTNVTNGLMSWPIPIRSASTLRGK